MKSILYEPIKTLNEEIETSSYIVRRGGKLNKAISVVIKALSDHFEKEDEAVLPLFGFMYPVEKDEYSNNSLVKRG